MHPGLCLTVERRGNRGVGLEEAVGAQEEGDVADRHGQLAQLRQDDLRVALENGLVLGLQVDRDDAHLGEPGAQDRQARLQQGEVTARAEDEAQHDLTGGGEGQYHVLELAPTRTDVIRHEPDLVDEVGHPGDQLLERLLVQAAGTQVDAVGGGVEDPDGDGSRASTDDELGLVAERGLGAGTGLEPRGVRGDVSQGAATARILVGELHDIRDAHQGARTTAAGVEVVALHHGQGYGSADVVRTTGGRHRGGPLELNVT